MASKKKPVVSGGDGIKKLEIISLKIADIIPNEYNPNRQSDQEFELLCRSIEEDGFTQPILVRAMEGQPGKWRIVDGEHRWRAMKALGKTLIPSAIAETDMDEIQAKISTLRHNRARGSENIQAAADVIKDLQEMGALEWTADSLMMSEPELAMMIRSIPENSINVREEGMDYEQTMESLQEEQRIQNLRKQEDAMMARRDGAKYTLQMTLTQFEATVVRTIIGSDQAKGILAFCQEVSTWANDAI